MRYKKGYVMALLLVLVVATVGISGCGKDADKFPTLNEVKKVMENHGFVETDVEQDFTGPELLETLRFEHGKDVTYSLSIYKDNGATKDLVETVKKEKDGALLKKYGKDSETDKTVLKDDKNDEFQVYAKRWGDDAYVLVREKNTFTVIDISAKDDEAFADCVKRLNDVQAELGIKGEI